MLCASADIVIEASRPRALRQLGIDAEEIIAANPSLTWISITGYGRREPAANWVAFGDDAAVAAGLSQILFDIHGEALFCGDAIADPLTGLHAAVAAWHSYKSGGGSLIAIALRDVVAHCVTFGGAFSSQLLSQQILRERCNEWRAVIERAQLSDYLPSARKPSAAAAALGADTDAVLRELNIPC
jgi:CoA transferase family III